MPKLIDDHNLRVHAIVSLVGVYIRNPAFKSCFYHTCQPYQILIQQFILEFLDSHRGAILLTDGQYKAVCSRLRNSIRNQPRKQSFETEAASGAP